MKFDSHGRKIEESTGLIPESDQQELWEQNGRIKALIAFAELRETMTVEEIKAMLGGAIHEE